MAFQYPSQRFQDWLSQRWVMLCGRRVESDEIDWLMGPYGEVDVIADTYVERLARDENLEIETAGDGAGLLQSIDELALPDDDRARLRPEIAAFYEHTADHELEVWSRWCLFFRPFGGLIHWLYSRRLQQLNLPLSPLDTARGMQSEIIRLRERGAGDIRYTIWLRRLAATGNVIYSGVYTTCDAPGDGRCVKVIFPLPRGNATVVMRVTVGPKGELDLVSSGRTYGDPGFYFLLHDKRRRHYWQYIRSFRERILVYVDDDGVLRADHTLTQWGLRVLELHYKITRARG